MVGRSLEVLICVHHEQASREIMGIRRGQDDSDVLHHPRLAKILHQTKVLKDEEPKEFQPNNPMQPKDLPQVFFAWFVMGEVALTAEALLSLLALCVELLLDLEEKVERGERGC